jgi:chromosome segregation ATPase
MDEKDFQKIDSMIARHVGTFADSIQHKLDLVVEGHQMLSEKIDRVEIRLDKRMDCLEHKLAAVAAETSGNTIAIRGLTAETKSNTLAIRDLSAKTESNTLAIRDLATKTESNTVEIRDLTTETKSNTLAINDLAAETRGNTAAIRDLAVKLDGVAADLSAHRADTEAHHTVFRVKE